LRRGVADDEEVVVVVDELVRCRETLAQRLGGGADARLMPGFELADEVVELLLVVGGLVGAGGRLLHRGIAPVARDAPSSVLPRPAAWSRHTTFPSTPRARL